MMFTSLSPSTPSHFLSFLKHITQTFTSYFKGLGDVTSHS
jgi:hypothetical protein